MVQFEELPSEVRLRIYRAVYSNTRVSYRQHRTRRSTELTTCASTFLVSRASFHESHAVFLSNLILVPNLHDWRWGTEILTKQLCPSSLSRIRKVFLLHLDDCAWWDLLDILPKLELVINQFSAIATERKSSTYKVGLEEAVQQSMISAHEIATACVGDFFRAEQIKARYANVKLDFEIKFNFKDGPVVACVDAKAWILRFVHEGKVYTIPQDPLTECGYQPLCDQARLQKLLD